MKSNQKGFTLIELLAVIVILAIIALIAVPVIMNIITESRKSASVDSTYSILNSAELYYAEQLLVNSSEAFTETTFTFNGDGTISPSGKLNFKGTKPTAGTVILDSTGKAKIGTAIVINGFSCTEDPKDTEKVVCASK